MSALLPGTLPEPGQRAVRRRAGMAANRPSRRPAHDVPAEERSAIAHGWKRWWPVGLGIAVSCAAPWLVVWLGALEPWGMRLVFPYVLLCGRHELGLSEEMTRMLPQLMLYLQFPAEGLLTAVTLRRGVSLAGAFGQLVLINGLGAIVLMLLAAPPQ